MLLFMGDYDGLCHLGLPCVLSKTCCYAIIRNYNGLCGLLSLPDSQRTCGRGGGWEANDAVPPPRGVGRDSDIYIRVQRVLLLNLSYLKPLCINHSILLLYT